MTDEGINKLTRKEALAIFEDNDTIIENPNYLFTEIGEAWDMAIEALKEEERPHGEWIPCSDRLPEIRFDLNSRTSDTVFVCLENRTMHMAFYCEDNVWRFCESGEAKEPMWDKVVAWIPLPERYEKEGDEK